MRIDVWFTVTECVDCLHHLPMPEKQKRELVLLVLGNVRQQDETLFAEDPEYDRQLDRVGNRWKFRPVPNL
jgi:hypothetical protein